MNRDRRSMRRAGATAMAGVFAGALAPWVLSSPAAAQGGLQSRRGGGGSVQRTAPGGGGSSSTTPSSPAAASPSQQQQQQQTDTVRRVTSSPSSPSSSVPRPWGSDGSGNGGVFIGGQKYPAGPGNDNFSSGLQTRTNRVTLPPKGHLPGGGGSLPSAPGSVILPPKPDPYNNNIVSPGLPGGWPNGPENGVYRPGMPQYTMPRSGFIVNGPTQVIGDHGITIFDGYRTIYVPGQTCVSPYSIYNAPPYIGSGYVITAPYVFLSGREIGSFWPFADNDRYYAADVQRGRSLRGALADLTRFWTAEDVRALRRRISPDLSVAIFQDERYTYSLRRREFLALSTDALDRVGTVSFRFNQVRDRNDGLVNAYARHVFRVRGEAGTRAATARYTLVYVDGDWYVSAVSLSPTVSGATDGGRAGYDDED